MAAPLSRNNSTNSSPASLPANRAARCLPASDSAAEANRGWCGVKGSERCVRFLMLASERQHQAAA
jgi:hypothetical protein